MRISRRPVLVFAIGVIVALTTIVISIELAWHQGISDESSLSIGYGEDTLHRLDEAAAQIGDGVLRIENANLPPCSPGEVELMRHISLTSSYLHGMGRIRNSQMICTSYGNTDPIPLGPPHLYTSHGLAERLNVRLSITDSLPIDIIETHGLGFFFIPDLAVDTPTEGPKTAITVFIPSSPRHAILATRNLAMPEDWFRNIAPGATVTFRSNGYVVAVIRSAKYDLAVISASPDSYAWQHVRNFAMIFIPLGLVSAVVLAWAVAVVSRNQLSLPAELRRAARRKEFIVEYQPLIDLKTRQPFGAEALVRWKRRSETVSPDSFIAVAEQTGVICDITACVFEQVEAALPGFLAVHSEFHIALNLSASDLREPATIGHCRRLLATGIAPGHLKLEATERGLVQEHDTGAILEEIRALGVEIAIDDFGIGYSSLSRIQAIRPDVLKIDKSFTDAIGTGGVTSQVIPHILDMAQSLKLTVIAEGIETEAQAAYMLEHGVLFAQGYLFGRPMPATHLAELLSRSHLL